MCNCVSMLEELRGESRGERGYKVDVCVCVRERGSVCECVSV